MMETALVPVHPSAALAAMGAKAENLLIAGNLEPLSPEERVAYYKAVCDSLGLNPLTQPFEYISLNNKLRLYAKRDCTDQLRKIHGVSIRIVAREVVDECYVVTVQAMDRSGRTDEAIGAVTLGNLKGDQRANAMMKAETKAKRRVTLSICGLGMLDESEADSVPGARFEPLPSTTAPPARTTPPTPAAESGERRFTSPAAPEPANPEYPGPGDKVPVGVLGDPVRATGAAGVLTFEQLFGELEAIEATGEHGRLAALAVKAAASHKAGAVTDGQREALLASYRAVAKKLRGAA